MTGGPVVHTDKVALALAVQYDISGTSFTASKPEVWSPVAGIEEFALAPDGKQFAILMTPSIKTKVTFAVNFCDELRGRFSQG